MRMAVRMRSLVNDERDVSQTQRRLIHCSFFTADGVSTFSRGSALQSLLFLAEISAILISRRQVGNG